MIDGRIIATWMKDNSELDGVTYILTQRSKIKKSNGQSLGLVKQEGLLDQEKTYEKTNLQTKIQEH